MEGPLAEIRSFAGNFPPRGWVFCNGQLLSIAQWTAVFALVGTTYGGNGQTTFGVPDLRGRVPVGPGQGPGLPNFQLGEMAGEASHTLTVNELPAHVHPATAPAATASTTATPTNALATGPATLGAGVSKNFGAPTANMAAPPVVGITGGSQPHNNLQPYLGMNYIMCVEGIFPSRN